MMMRISLFILCFSLLFAETGSTAVDSLERAAEDPFVNERMRMVDRQIVSRGIQDPKVLREKINETAAMEPGRMMNISIQP